MRTFFGEETFRSAFDSKNTPKLSYGVRFPEACAKHVQDTFKSTRVYIVASKSLCKNTDSLTRLTDCLQGKVAGVRIGISPHTPIAEALEIIEDIRKGDGIDCLITLGAGSITDCAKLVRFALANEAYTEDQIDTLWGGHSFNTKAAKSRKDPTIPLICIPTSLSGGEYQAIAGATERVSHAKRTFECNRDPDLIIQDPELCGTTPPHIWLSSGVRAIDHCVETLCSLQSNDEGDLWALQGLKKLVPGLLMSKKGYSGTEMPIDSDEILHARHLCQLGVVEAMCAVSTGVPLGASHAIGHQLGPLGVGHGETSCILLPAVCKFNADNGANNSRQAKTMQALVQDETVKTVLKNAGKSVDNLSDLLDIIIRELGMPRKISEVVTIGPEEMKILAENSLTDIWIQSNAVKITESSQVMEILSMVV